MNNKSLVKLSNIIGIISITLLVYWVFIFICIQVFGFKVFRENLTETFYLSIVGILALMFGALIINIMFNLTRIAEKHNQDSNANTQKFSKNLGLILCLSFPIIFGVLFGGDYLTSKTKEKMLISSAKSIVESDSIKSGKLLNYTFDKKWLTETTEVLAIYSKTDTNFPTVSVIVSDTLSSSQIFLGFERYNEYMNDTIPLKKADFIRETTREERDYLTKVFSGETNSVRFSASDGHYELFYPFIKNGKKIVLYFSDFQRYGKIGS